MKTTARYATLVVLAHAAVVLWHLVLVAKITPGLTSSQILAATTAVNALPAIALLLLWIHHPRLGGLLLFLPLLTGLIIGAKEHFVTPGPLNVFDMTPTPWVHPFQVTTILLAVLELAGVCLAIQAVRGISTFHAEATQQNS